MVPRRFHFLLFCFIRSAISSDVVQILGLFPEQQYPSSVSSILTLKSSWTTQCMAMFRAAITLSHQYDIRVNGHRINYTILQTNDGNGFEEVNVICRRIASQTLPGIVGIVGPASSSNAGFLASFAAHIGLPLVSYAATNADLADPYVYQTFYRTVPSDALLVKAIVQLFEKFSWKSCTMILGNDAYGYGAFKVLSEMYHANLTIKGRLIFNPRLNEFHSDLKQTLEKSQSRIVLLWVNYTSSIAIIKHALKEGLMGGSYVWLMTDKLELSEFEGLNWHELAGLLAVMPIEDNGRSDGVNETLREEALNAWRNSPVDNSSYPSDPSNISPYAMYTFDATWTLIRALNKSSFDGTPESSASSYCFDSLLKNSAKYYQYLQATHFLGVSGIVQFSNKYSNDRVDGTFYALYNLQRTGNMNGGTKVGLKYKQVMEWSQASRNWTNLAYMDIISIVWPNKQDSRRVPADHPQLRGQHLRILVIEAPPFVMVRNISSSRQAKRSIEDDEQFILSSNPLPTEDSNTIVYGLAVDLIRELEAQMHFTYTISVATPTTSYHSLVQTVANENRQWDIVISDIRITSTRLLTVDFSTPFHENTFRMITRQHSSSFAFSLFSCLSPFTWDVWVAIFGVITYSGMIIYVFERRNIKSESGEGALRALIMGIFQALGSLLIMNSELRLTTNSSRVTVLGLYALGIILVATYTANLSSFLTLTRAQSSISGIDDIKNGRLPFSRIGIVTNSALSDYYIQNISSIFYPLSTAKDMYLRLLDNTIDASMWDSTVLEYSINNYYCNNLAVVGVGFVKSSFGIVMPKNWQYKMDLDRHILSMRESERLELLENKWLQRRQCSMSPNGPDKSGEKRSETFSLDVLGGLFLTYFIVTAIALGLYFWQSRARINAIFEKTIVCIKAKLHRMRK